MSDSLETKLSPFLSEYKSTYYETSENLINDTTYSIYNFDKICGNTFKSSDCIYVKKDKIYFIEFKDSPPKYSDTTKSKKLAYCVNLKMYDSILVFSEFLSRNGLISGMRNIFNYDIVFIFVFSKIKEDATFRLIDIENRNRAAIKTYYALDRYEGNILKKAYTINDEIFISTMLPVMHNVETNS